jgi:hypothetical protein
LKQSKLRGLPDTNRLSLLGPKEREIDPLGQSLGGKFCRLTTRGVRFDNAGARKASRIKRLA